MSELEQAVLSNAPSAVQLCVTLSGLLGVRQ